MGPELVGLMAKHIKASNPRVVANAATSLSKLLRAEQKLHPQQQQQQ
jgi:hypothetical protein